MKILRAVPTIAIIILIPVTLLQGAQRSGWSIFQKIQSAQFHSNVLSGLGFSDMTSVLYNPAVPATFHRTEYLFTSEIGPVDDHLGALLVGVPFGKHGMFSLGGGYYDAGPVELNWVENDALQTATVSLQKDMLAIASLGYALSPKWSAGVSLKGASNEVAEMETAYAYAGDAGVMYMPKDDLSFSAAVQNMGDSTKFIDEANILPASVYFGMGKGFERGEAFGVGDMYFLSSVGVTYLLYDERSIPEIGCEFDYGPLAMSAGYQLFKDESNMHVGFTIAEKGFVFGYAFIPGQFLGNTHRITISYHFYPRIRRERFVGRFAGQSR